MNKAKIIQFPPLIKGDNLTFGMLQYGQYYVSEIGDLRKKTSPTYYTVIAGKYGALSTSADGLADADEPIIGYFDVDKIVFENK